MTALRAREARPALALALIAAVAYAAVALVKHLHGGTGLDLGLFTQAVFNYGNFDAPLATVKGNSNLLGDHFHPLVALFAPFGWLGIEASGLLVAQALLVAASIVPVWVFARERLERRPALAIAVGYSLFWGIWAGVSFEFHEVAFAPLLVALGILWGDRRQWGRFALVMALLLLVKEDMALLVAFFGLWLLTGREWKVGGATAIAGVVAYFVITESVIPHYAGGADFRYWSYDRIGTDLADAARNVATRPWLPFEVAFDHGQKVRTMAAMVAPFLLLPFVSRVGLLGLPLVAERMLSTNSLYWGTFLHYTLALSPVLATAAADGLANVAPRIPDARRAQALTVAGVAIVALNLIANEGAAHTARELKRYAREPSWGAAARQAVERVPDGASVASQDFVYPRLAARRTADIIRPGIAGTDYLVLNPFVQAGNATGNPGGFAGYGRQVRAILPRYTPVWESDGWIVLRRRSQAGERRRALSPARCARLRERARTQGTQSGASLTVAAICQRS